MSLSWRARRRGGLFVLLAALVALTGCGGSSSATSAAAGGAVPVKIAHGKGGAVLAIAPVFIAGKGPFVFAVDTGAARSVVDKHLAATLHLTGPSARSSSTGQTTLQGVACSSNGTPVRLATWRVGTRKLSADTAVSVDMAGQLQGLLGSDVLSDFGAVTLDYGKHMLRLGTSLAAATSTVPLDVVHGKQGAVLAVAPVFIHGQGPFSFAVDTGASQSVLDQGLAQQLKIPVTSTKGAAVNGVACSTHAATVRVSNWRVGGTALPTQTVYRLNLPGSAKSGGLRGLIGSDVLSHFHRITVDYRHGRLLLK